MNSGKLMSNVMVLGVAISCGLGLLNISPEVAKELDEPLHFGEGDDPCARAALPDV